MSDTDLARSWWGIADGTLMLPRGGEPPKPEPKEKEAREPEVTLSARDLS